MILFVMCKGLIFIVFCILGFEINQIFSFRVLVFCSIFLEMMVISEF